MLIALQLIPLVSVQGEIELFQTVHCNAQWQSRELEEENQSRGGAGTAVRRNIDYTPNQCKMLTGLWGRKSWQPNCVS